MGNVVLFMSISLDGYFAGPDGGLDWQLVDEEVHQHFNDVLRDAGGFLDGRVTHELMVDFWPTADQQPDSPPQIREFAGIWRDMPKWVFSRTLETASWNTTVVREVVSSDIEQLKRERHGDLFVGGADLVSTFRRLGLIDEYRIYVHPVVLGQGRPLFTASDTPTSLELIETHTFGNGVVLLRYRSLDP